MLEQFVSTIDRLVGTLQSYPEAPYIIGALSLIFAVSFILVLREVAAWFFKTSKIAAQTNELQQELKEIRYSLKQISETVNVDPTRYISKSKVGSNFPKTTFATEPKMAQSNFVEPTPIAAAKTEKVENKIFSRGRDTESTENVIKDAVTEKAREKGFPLSH